MKSIPRRCVAVLAVMPLLISSVCAFAETRSAVKVGLMTVKTGTMAGPGKDLQDGFDRFLSERGGVLAGHKIELFSVDSAGSPAIAKTRASELTDLHKVDVVIGPLASFEAIAIADSIVKTKTPLLISSAGSEDITQRQASPWITRSVATNAQPMYSFGDYVFNKLRYKRVVAIGEDVAFAYEALGGFQRAYEKAGGKIAEKIWAPLGTTDYSAFLAKMPTDVDAVVALFTGASSVKFLKQYSDYGFKDKMPLLASTTMLDEALLPSLGDEAIGVVSPGWYSAAITTPANLRFVADFKKATKHEPGTYAVGSYVAGQMLEEALSKLGDAPTREEIALTLRKASLKDTPRGPVVLDAYGNPDADMYIRKTERKDGRLINSIVATYPNVSQFGSLPAKEFLAQPVFSRSYPR